MVTTTIIPMALAVQTKVIIPLESSKIYKKIKSLKPITILFKLRKSNSKSPSPYALFLFNKREIILIIFHKMDQKWGLQSMISRVKKKDRDKDKEIKDKVSPSIRKVHLTIFSKEVISVISITLEISERQIKDHFSSFLINLGRENQVRLEII